MKVGILTFHRADNYGAVLQTYALYAQCCAMGYDVKVIDYRCNAIERAYPPIKFPKLRKNMYQWCIDAINYLRFGNAWKDKAGKFDLFRALFQMSSSYYDTASKNKVEKEFDYIITGSDQIWSVDTLDKKIDYWYCYKKEFAHPVKVISYAASAGSLSRFKETFCEFEPVLSEYDALSVREEGVQGFLEEKMQRKVYTVVDPTLLVDRQLWLQMIEGSANRCDNYLVYYDVAQNRLSRNIAKAIAKHNQYSVVKFNQIKSPTHKTEYLSDAGPIDFLNSIYNARCVVTSSFHATVFSILYHKQFVAALHPTTGERVKSLLTKLGLADRIVYEYNDNVTELMNQPIDYAPVDLKLSKLREESIDFLKAALSL